MSVVRSIQRARSVIGVMIVMVSVWLTTAAGASGDWRSYGEDLANSRSQSRTTAIGKGACTPSAWPLDACAGPHTSRFRTGRSRR